MTSPRPFETSLSARLLLVAVAIVTIGGGLIPLLGLNPNIAPPLILVAGGLTALVGIVLGIYDHPLHVLMAALIGPCALWVMTMVVLSATTRPTIGWALIALGTIPMAFGLASMRRAQPAPALERRPLHG